MDAVERFLDRLVAKDFAGLRETLAADGFRRVGPFGEVAASRDEYVDLVTKAVGGLEGYAIEVRRIVRAGNDAVAEVRESAVVDGTPTTWGEAMVFDLDGDVIRGLSAYLMCAAAQRMVWGVLRCRA